jgi:DNA-directed RNA polymerase subunit L
MATFGIINTKSKVSMTSEFRNFPLTFVNGLRRVLLSEIPTVVIRDVQIIQNTTQMPHEMLKHRMELLPVNVQHTDSSTIKDAIVELRVLTQPESTTITTDDFVVQSGHEHLLMKDRDLNTPILFLRMKAGESVHIKGKLAVEKGSQVCTASMQYTVDPERAEIDKKKYVEAGNDPRVFDNFYIQKSYYVDERGRPNWININIETVGVLSPRDIMKLAISELKRQIDSWMNNASENITREKEENVYHIKLDQGGHTIGALMQEIIYHSDDSDFVSYDIPHPMRPTMILRFITTKKPESILKDAHKRIQEYCDIVEKGL